VSRANPADHVPRAIEFKKQNAHPKGPPPGFHYDMRENTISPFGLHAKARLKEYGDKKLLGIP
jgi:hypothetical protein